jgi:hypothetical protein
MEVQAENSSGTQVDRGPRQSSLGRPSQPRRRHP